LRPSSPSLAEVKNEKENLEIMPTVTMEEYLSDFLALEKKIVHDIEG